MGNRYYYDKHGNYKGCSSDEPPSDNGCCGCAIIFILACVLFNSVDEITAAVILVAIVLFICLIFGEREC